MRIQFRPGALALLAVVPLAACEQVTEPTSSEFERASSLAVVTDPTLHREQIKLCKVGPDGVYDFTYTGTDFRLGTSVSGSISVAAGECVSVGFFPAEGASLDITEVVPAGQEVASITVEQLVSADRTIAGPTNTVTGVLSGGPNDDGAVVTFTNRLLPPPPQGGQGCTPGYWKQKHHFDSWPSPYTPDMLFSDVFDDAFPGMTLVEVAAQGGGQLKALGRHTVAALLNAASSGVDYDLTVNDVITSFNAAFQFGDYNGLKDIFEDYNEQGCPLN